MPEFPEHEAMLRLLRARSAEGLTLLAKGPWPKGTGVRPTLVAERDDGVCLWRLSNNQCARWIETICARMALGEHPGELPTLSEDS